MKKKMFCFVVAMICVLACGTWAFASGLYTKDNGTIERPTFVEGYNAGALNQSLSSQLVSLYGEGTYTGQTVYDNGSEKIVSVFQDGNKLGWHLINVDGIVELFVLDDHEYIFMRESTIEKISDELLEAMDESQDELIPVYVWLKDIDTEEVLSALPATLSAHNSALNDELYSQNYMMQKRECLSKAYENYNSAFLTSFYEKTNETQISTSVMYVEDIVTPTLEVNGSSFASAYSPMCLLELLPSQILEMVEDERVSEIGLLPEIEIASCATVGADSVQGSYVRDTNGYTGEGAVVGIIEANGLPNVALPELVGADIEVNEDIPAVTDDHATRVAAIICGQTVGLAPDCKVYATYVRATESVAEAYGEFFWQMEWLLSKGVHVINASMGFYGSIGVYGVIDKWVDHVDMNHDVLVVSAAGNSKYDKRVTSPAMSYNGIAVGAYDDAGDASHSNDLLAEFSCYIETDYDDEDDFLLHAEKPDLIAPGVNIDIPGMVVSEDQNTGTSFAAPFVTGTVAQMIDAKPELKSQPAIIKAALLASAFRKINPSNYASVGGTWAMSDKEGAGKLDSKNAIYVIASTNYTYEYFWSSTTSYTFSIFANASETQMRVALTWLKQCVLSDDVVHNGYGSLDSIEERPMADWDMEVYDPNGNRITYSYAENGNVEIVEFDPEITGTYTIKIIKVGGSAPKEFVYLAWW